MIPQENTRPTVRQFQSVPDRPFQISTLLLDEGSCLSDMREFQDIALSTINTTACGRMPQLDTVKTKNEPISRAVPPASLRGVHVAGQQVVCEYVLWGTALTPTTPRSMNSVSGSTTLARYRASNEREGVSPALTCTGIRPRFSQIASMNAWLI